MSGIQVSPEILTELYARISEIDVQVDTSAAAGKRAITSRLVEQNLETVSPAVETVKELLAGFSAGSLAAAVSSIESVLRDLRKETVDPFLAELVDSQEKPEEVSDEEKKKLLEERRTLVEQFKAAKTILGAFGHDVSEFKEPRQKRGATPGTPRAPQFLKQFQYEYDGTTLSEENNSLSFIAGAEGIKTKALKNFINEQGVSLKKGDTEDEWEAKTPAGKLIRATRLAEFVEDGDEEESAE